MIHNSDPTGRRHLPAAERREQIARVALDLIAHHGLKGLSMAAVARRLGLVPSAIYRHFRSKDELIDATLELIAARLEHNVREATRVPGDSLDVVGRLLELHIELIRDAQAIPRLIFSDEVHWRRPERKRRIHAMLAHYLEHIAEAVRAGQRAGRIRADLDPETVGFMYLGLIQPAGVLWYLTDGRFDVTRQVRKAWGVLRSAIELRPVGGVAARGRRRQR
jgi:AcrR family transcriptional regulator